jgi:hypothetical protein
LSAPTIKSGARSEIPCRFEGCARARGTTLAALITVDGIWAVAVGVMRIVLAFEMKRLPEIVDEAWSDSASNGAPLQDTPAKPPVPHTG